VRASPLAGVLILDDRSDVDDQDYRESAAVIRMS
jgi:hypothetical protein